MREVQKKPLPASADFKCLQLKIISITKAAYIKVVHPELLQSYFKVTHSVTLQKILEYHKYGVITPGLRCNEQVMSDKCDTAVTQDALIEMPISF